MLADEISKLASQGRSCFGFDELQSRMSSTPGALKAALRRLLKKGDLAMPLRGFYVIVPPEYRALGCRPAEQFLAELMNHLGEDYYAGLLSAAAYQGAAHHRPQVLQVVVTKPRRSILCGRVKVDFVVRKNLDEIPTLNRNTPAGVLKISTPKPWLTTSRATSRYEPPLHPSSGIRGAKTSRRWRLFINTEVGPKCDCQSLYR